MQLLQNTKITAFVIVLIVLLQVAAYVYYVRPVQEQRNELASQLDNRRQLLSALEQAEQPQNDPGYVVQLAQVRTEIPELPYPELLLRELRLLEAVGDVQMKYYNIQVGEQALANGQSTFPPFAQTGSSGANAGASGSAGTAGGTLSAEQQQTLQQFGQTLYPVTITTEFEGGYIQIRRLLAEVETLNRIWHVTNLTLNESTSIEQVAINVPNRQLRCQITFRAYYAPTLQQIFKQPLPIWHEEPGKRTVPF